MSQIKRSRVLLFSVVAALSALASCSSEQMVIQRAGKAHYHDGFKYVGVFVEHASVRIRGWSADSAAIAVSMPASVKHAFSFVVDSVDDSLLLLGKFRGDSLGAAQSPEANLDIPAAADLTITSTESVTITGMTGPARIDAHDSIALVGARGSAVTARSSAGWVVIDLPASANVDLDLECGPAGQLVLESHLFHGKRQKTEIKGMIGTGGPKITARGNRGVEVQIHGE